MFKKDPDNFIDVTADGSAALRDDDVLMGEERTATPEAEAKGDLRPEMSDKRGYVKSSAQVGDEAAAAASGALDASDVAFLAPELVAEAEGPVRALERVEGRYAYRFAKRAFDIAFSLVAIALFLVPLFLLCVAIRLESDGSPIYKQRRVGRWGRPLDILKLRTMIVDSDDVEKYLDPEQLEQWLRERKVDNDPRTTRVGTFLRRTSLDELPQFLNVLIGQMSVVGPRPVVEEELEAYGESVDKFLSAKPGVTGWWQVRARNDATYADGSRQELELYYVDHASFGLDAKVFFETFRAMFRQTGK